ncbi:hypothetical protein D1815_04830 [Aquimarina sp. AD1]|uniref:DUF5777 family beta-barrel protein n=1 Tax=Aquimarina sp. (strain AD1) TaxID=1714848 RepID=UPI000E47E6A8|nr:DUF5777 family beta-barrel protein [Aquimarina sp. AD1]AXT55113.1 hypothetical protein D1815_04830 [Aquimarina sp. AD1]RKN03157.1 hypothetical protein D7035_22470 [Aquimarina sp. AD1]
MKNFLIVFALWALSSNSYAQDLLDILEDETPQTKSYTTSTFKGTRILNGHSVENRNKGTLEFVISHRFGRVNLGIDELYGLDQSNIRFAFEYGLSDNIMLGVGRSSFDKTYDGFIKYKFLKQSTGEGSFPFTASLFSSIAYRTLKDFDPENEPTFSQKLSYVSQILIARKFSPAFSLQITPTYIHRNSVKINDDPHDIFAVGIGSRLKLTKRISINGEYFYTANPLESIDATNSLAFGVDIETGGHVFQIILSNSITMIEKSFIAESTDNFFEGDIHLGFNISRAFQVGNKKKRKLNKMKNSGI